MIYLVLGTPDSGKSAKAESIVMDIAGAGKKYYIATMIPYGEEGTKRVKKHRDMRAGKGFETIECPVKVHELISRTSDLKDATVLLECMSNLIGNEMHNPEISDRINFECEAYGKADKADDLAKMCDYIVDSVMTLAMVVENIVIVANHFSLEDEGYDEDTRRYVTLVDMVNTELKKRVDKVYELI